VQKQAQVEVPWSENMTRQEVRAAILAVAEKLKQVPTVPELMKHAGIDRPEIRKHFGNYKQALEECNLEVPERGRKVEIDRLFLDWAEVVRALKKIPTVFEYERRSKYSSRPLTRCAGSWNMVAERMKLYADENGLDGEFRDVLELVDSRPGGERGGAAVSSTEVSTEASAERLKDSRPTYGALIAAWGHVYGPTNEGGVISLFGAMAATLGFLILKVQSEFPDCEAVRVAGKDRNRPVRIEFEYESRNFLRHMHDPNGCDIIVCWEHNWPECPLEVVELKNAVRQSQVFTTEARRRGEKPELKGKGVPLMNTDDTDLKGE
jgi:Homing endonuclease associated repeat